MIAYLAALIALLGFILVMAASNPKVVHLGYILFAVGMLVVTWMLGQKTVKLF